MMLVFLRWKLCLSQRCQCLETYQGCALIGGSPVFGTCEIQGAQHMLRFFEKAKISKKPKNRILVTAGTALSTVKSKGCLFCSTHPHYQPNVPLMHTDGPS